MYPSFGIVPQSMVVGVEGMVFAEELEHVVCNLSKDMFFPPTALFFCGKLDEHVACSAFVSEELPFARGPCVLVPCDMATARHRSQVHFCHRFNPLFSAATNPEAIHSRSKSRFRRCVPSLQLEPKWQPTKTKVTGGDRIFDDVA